jgi:starvation-inducible DNA-binding protein
MTDATTAAGQAHIREHLGTPADLTAEPRGTYPRPSAAVLADVFALYLKTKSFHWHMSGRHFHRLRHCYRTSISRLIAH